MSLRDQQIGIFFCVGSALTRMISLQNNNGDDSSNSSSKSQWKEPWRNLAHGAPCLSEPSSRYPLLQYKTHDGPRPSSIIVWVVWKRDVPVVYFCLPTEENIQRITNDLSDEMYDSFYLNFVSTLPTKRMELLAHRAVVTTSVNSVSKIYDQHLRFISLSPRVFSLHIPQSYVAMHDPTLPDEALSQSVDEIVEGLFSVVITSGELPIIRAPRGGPSELVARRLDARLRKQIKEGFDVFLTQPTGVLQTRRFQRPMLALFDRDMDLCVTLHHTWTYQALTHDLLNMSLNRVSVAIPGSGAAEGGSSAAPTNRKRYDIDPTERFWRENAERPFPLVAEEVEKQVSSYTETYERMTRSADAIGVAAGTGLQHHHTDGAGTAIGGSGSGSTTEQLASAISSLPELTERKRQIDMHTSIATAILNEIKDRQLDTYFSVEENALARGMLDYPAVLELIKDTVRGTKEDKLRLAIIAFLCSPNMPDSEYTGLQEALKEVGADPLALSYLRQQRGFRKPNPMMTVASSGKVTGTSSYHSRLAQLGVSDQILSFADKAYSKGVSGVIAGMKSLLPSKKDLPITQALSQLMSLQPGPQTEPFIYLDPKLSDEAARESVRSRSPFTSAIVCVIGGGNFVEYQNIQEAAKSAHWDITYGGTEMVSPTEFLGELETLAQKTFGV